MGKSRGVSGAGEAAGYRPGWRKDDPGSSGPLRRFLEGGEPTRFKRKYPLPSPGDRFGELTVECGLGGDRILVRCSCGAGSYAVLFTNLRLGRTTRCQRCGDREAKATVRKRRGLAAVVPDNAQRKRLLCRFSAAVSRCHNKDNAGYENYGARGIFVAPEWRANKRLFLEHVVTLPGWDDPSLDMDRKDVDGPYAPGNIRFVTRTVNAKNKRSVRGMQRRIAELERRLRHCQCGAAQPVHDPHE